MAAKRTLTTPDLVVLSMLSEKPRHGYELNLELERRDVRDWAGISRPQVYYSLAKLARAHLIRPAPAADREGPGPEREVYAVTAAGRTALVRALERADWAEHCEVPPFLTWMALSQHARPAAVAEQIERRRGFLDTQLARERQTLGYFENEEGYEFDAARSMVELTIAQFEAELDWLKRVKRRFARYTQGAL
jgi:DNA-binding PadR family transcriptional regulator